MSFIHFTRSTIGCVAATTLTLFASGSWAQAAPITLGEAGDFAVLSSTAITNTGASLIYGDAGVSPAGSITGFSSVVQVGGGLHINNAVSSQAQVDLAVAYNILVSETPTANLSGQNLGARTLTPGVYRFDTEAGLTGTLLLDAGNNPDARFDFQIGSTLTTASASSVVVINGGSPNNVFWQVGSSATLGTNTVFQGNILARTSITLTTGVENLNGRALALDGAVTMDANRIGVAVVPETGTSALIAFGMLLVPAVMRRRSTIW